MRRLIVEGIVKEFQNLTPKTSGIQIQKVKTFEILHVLRFDKEESAAICKIIPKEPQTKLEEIYGNSQIHVVPLETQEDGSYICFVKTKPQQISQDLIDTGVYFSGLGEIRNGKVKVGLIGETKKLKAFLNLIESTGAHLNVLLLTETPFSSNSPLAELTEKQRSVIVTAFEGGYYDLPRKIGSVALSKKLGMRSSTLIEHRRKAEYKLLAALINK